MHYTQFASLDVPFLSERQGRSSPPSLLWRFFRFSVFDVSVFHSVESKPVDVQRVRRLSSSLIEIYLLIY